MMRKKGKSPKLSKAEGLLDNEDGWTELDPKGSLHKEVLADVSAITESVKEERATIRFNRRDLVLLKAKAERKGLGYQTLIGSIVHMYVTGQLLKIDETRLALKAVRKKRA